MNVCLFKSEMLVGTHIYKGGKIAVLGSLPFYREGGRGKATVSASLLLYIREGEDPLTYLPHRHLTHTKSYTPLNKGGYSRREQLV
jgi:hypothetical protein